jgi:[glutamine synthetase] adenylyltransferase / [glutamine synthetase]-adenylyl-L-tyrosine phosphorylase
MSALVTLVEQHHALIAALCEQQSQWLAHWRGTTTLQAELATLWLASDHAKELCQNQPQLLSDLLATHDLEKQYADWSAQLASFINRYEADTQAACERGDMASVQRVLRRFRQREWLRIVWREASGRASVMQSCHELSLLADACVHYALPRLQQQLAQQLGKPLAKDGTEQVLIVLALGKYGAYELNLSSDIDLILAFPEDGETVVDVSATANPTIDTTASTTGLFQPCTIQYFFTRLGQLLIAALDTITPDGFVFRIDLRLRPYGSAGALALSCEAMEEYYHSQGRDWERFAMIKARAVTGTATVVQVLMETLRAFTYRRYLDFSTLASLRDLKLQIEQQVRRKGLVNNIKLGSGGIREIEFIVQVLQVINGGRQRSLQQASLLTTLQRLVELALLPPRDATLLGEHYGFLRRLENAIQALRDQQTHDYPSDELAQARLACSLGFTDAAALSAQLTQVRQDVAALFANIIKPQQARREPSADERWQQLWLQTMEPTVAQAFLQTQHFQEPAEILSRLQATRQSRQVLALDKWGRERLDRFMPRLLAESALMSAPSHVFLRVFPFVQAVLRRSAYLVLLLENPLALKQLLQLCAASPWVVDLLSRYPALLDELLRPLQQPPPLQELQQRLQQQLLRSAPDDVEEQLRVIQSFKQEQLLNVAAAELARTMPLMKVSDYMTWIAETIVTEVLSLAWQQLTARHGFPANKQGQVGECDFVVIAYGKLGGLELSYGSDLDLVFLHDGHSELDTTSTASPLNSTAFYVQLGQKMLALLSTQTLMGKLYEIDLRLRPSGASGALVSTVESFRRYQQDSAWTWEHQALVRTRVIAGSATLASRFIEVRNAVLGKPRDLATLQNDILSMRERMLKQHGSRNAEQFDIKQDAGGLIDIEFIVQYAVLVHAAQHPALLRWSDNMRLLDALADAAVMPPATAKHLQALYLHYREQLHKLALNMQSSVVPAIQFANERAQVRQMWESVFSDSVADSSADSSADKEKTGA